MVEAGKQRSAGIVILLSIVTLGVYWFVWQWKAFGELEQAKGGNLQRRLFIPLMAVVWLLMLGVAGSAAADSLRQALDQQEGGATPATPTAPPFGPLQIAGLVIGVVFYGLQLVYQLRATKLVAASVPNGTDSPSTVLPILANVLMMCGGIPFVGILLSLGGLVVAIVWIVQVQGALNKIWMGQAPTLAPMNFAPQPTMR